MQYKHIRDIDFQNHVNERVYGIFLARDVEIRTQKDGVTKFIALNMCDKGVKLDVKKFSPTESELNLMQNGKVYLAAIDVKPYAKSPTGYGLTLYNFDTFDESPSNFVEWAEGIDSAQDTIQYALNIISESIYKDLVYNILVAHWHEFCIWSAASGMHHNVMGGLIVHTAEVIEQSEQIADLWESKYGPNFINKPLLLSGALLHDIAKTMELNVDRLSGSTSYSTQASLETHITMCAGLIDVEAYKLHLGYQTYKINEINEQEPVKTEEQLANEKEAVSLLKHLILSHHGKLEYGSPITPNCPEALILNAADGLSADMYRINKAFKTINGGESSSVWLNGSKPVITYKDSTK